MIQIKEIILYSHWGDTRSVSLKLGALNIITGKSKTGKSAIGRIIEYVLGSNTFGVFVGAIRNTVSWYGLVVQIGDTELFLARPDPGEQESTSKMYLQVSTDGAVPTMESLIPNTTTGAVRDRLARLTGIAGNTTDVPVSQVGRPSEAKLSHALIYCFQGQNVIANQDVLFHKQNEEFVPQAIRDTFPYFIGAVADDRLEKTVRLRQLRQQIRAIETELAELESLRISSSSRIRSLLDEALGIGLISSWSDETAMETLQAIASVNKPSDDNFVNEDPSSELRSSRNKLMSRFQDLQDAMRLARRYRDEQGGFDSEARQQLLRLKSVELYSESDSQQCPVCSQSIPETATTATDLLESIRQLDKQVAVAALEEPRLLEYITKLKAESDQLQKEIEGLDFRIEALAEQNRSLREQQHREMARGRTIGRASLFVESVAEVSVVDSSSRTQQLSLLRSEAAGLSAELDEESLRERLATLMAALSRQIVEMADRFELEHKGFGIRLDLRQLTLVVEQGGKSVPLSQIGSGENWVGYHLAFFLALHSWFRKLDRPVPAFLFIDQPTQAYFPAESDSEGNLAELAKDDDRIAVKRMFEIIVQVVSELAPKMQIILTDHADIAEDWFRDCVVQRWRNGNALIPVAWIERAEGASILSETEPSE